MARHDGTENLISLTNRTKEEQREIAIKGGKASGEARRKNRNMKECLKMLLSLDVKSPKAREQLKALGIDNEEMTNQMALMVSMLNKALKGDKGCAEFIRDTSGQQIVNKAEITEVPRIIDDIK
jgi:hypothetical protein